MNVLISSAGRRVSLVRLFQQALGELGGGRVLAADVSPLAPASYVADEGIRVPHCSSDDFVPTILDACQAADIRLVVPTIDPELPIYAASSKVFSDYGVSVLVPSLEAVHIAADKQRTQRWLAGEGFPTVATATVAEALSNVSAWEFPVIVKPVRGSASQGVATVTSADALGDYAGVSDLIVQERATGVEYTVDVWVDAGGQARCCVPRRRLEVRAGEVSKAMTCRLPRLQALAGQIAEALPGARGVITIQVFVDGESLRVIEINPRFGGGYPLSWQAGATYPLWILQELSGRRVDAGDRWTDGVVMLRYDAEVFVARDQVGL